MYHQLITIIRTNRFARIALGATLGISILVAIFSSFNTPNQVGDAQRLNNLANLSQTQRADAIQYRTGATDTLPIYRKGFMTSVGISTTIHIFVLESDPPETVRFEITGLSYANPNTDPVANPNVTAFQESFIHGLKLMRTAGLTPSRMVFVYSDIDYIQERATDWIDHLGLLD